MVAAGQAVTYFEPENKVVARSGQECIVALTDQWYLPYGQEDYKNRIMEWVTSPAFETFNPFI